MHDISKRKVVGISSQPGRVYYLQIESKEISKFEMIVKE